MYANFDREVLNDDPSSAYYHGVAADESGRKRWGGGGIKLGTACNSEYHNSSSKEPFKTPFLFEE